MSDFTMKRCSHCKETFPATNEFFNRNKSTLDGLFHWCKRCKREHDRDYRKSAKGKVTRSRNRKTEKSKVSQRIRSKRFAQTEKGRLHAIRSAEKARKEHPERTKARKEVQKAIQRKEIPKAKELTCAKCGLPARHYHHRNGYEPEHWFDIIPLCQQCHTAEHG